MRKKIIILPILCIIAALISFNVFEESKEKLVIAKAKRILGQHYFMTQGKSSNVEIDKEKIRIEYSIDEKLTNYILKTLKRYRTFKTAVVVIDNDSGKILSSVGYDGKKRERDDRLPFTSTHPSASLIKIVTAAAALDNPQVEPNTMLQYRGKGTTLYKYQLKDKSTKWTRYLSLERAFALSNNVIFGKLAIKYLTSVALFKMAHKFGFNQKIMEEISLSKSTFEMPKNNYHMAELASGFIRSTLISPIHAAMLSSIVARDGLFKSPSIVNKLLKLGEVEKDISSKPEEKRVINQEVAGDLKKLMVKAVSKGTARGGFRRMTRRIRRKLEIGGKTGSISGGFPHGKRDWFTSFAKPKSKFGGGNGISVAIMIINREKWYVRSSYLASKIIEFYYRKIKKLEAVK